MIGNKFWFGEYYYIQDFYDGTLHIYLFIYYRPRSKGENTFGHVRLSVLVIAWLFVHIALHQNALKFFPWGGPFKTRWTNIHISLPSYYHAYPWKGSDLEPSFASLLRKFKMYKDLAISTCTRVSIQTREWTDILHNWFNDGHNYLTQWWSAVTGGAVVRA